MTFYPDLGKATMITAGPHVRAVGWLDDKHYFPTGEVPVEFLRKLRRITEKHKETEAALYDNEFDFLLRQFFGFHTCELCRNFNHGGNIVVPDNDVLYVAPAMILHYVEEHGYSPPRQFVDAVLKAPNPRSKDYENAVAKFRKSHKDFMKLEEQTAFEEASRTANREKSPILDRILSRKEKTIR